jgi:hypothetical protein
MLLSLDPGMNSPGVALFVGGQLSAAARVAVPDGFADLPDGARWMHVGHEIATWARARGEVRRVVFEKPQWYQRGKSKGDPNQLVGVAGVAANVTGMLVCDHPIEVLSPTPAEWIGQLPKVCQTCKGKKTTGVPLMPGSRDVGKPARRVKTICRACGNSAWGTPRGRRIRSRLTDAEIALVPDQNDAIDAVGIGLFALGRLERVSVFSNGNDGR